MFVFCFLHLFLTVIFVVLEKVTGNKSVTLQHRHGEYAFPAEHEQGEECFSSHV